MDPEVLITVIGPSWNLRMHTVPYKLDLLSRRPNSVSWQSLGQQLDFVSWHFSGAKVAPCVHAQAMHFSYTLLTAQLLASAHLLNVTVLISSTGPMAVVILAFSCGRRFEAKNRKRIDDRVEPLGMLDVVDRILFSRVCSINVVVRLIRKEGM